MPTRPDVPEHVVKAAHLILCAITESVSKMTTKASALTVGIEMQSESDALGVAEAIIWGMRVAYAKGERTPCGYSESVDRDGLKVSATIRRLT